MHAQRIPPHITTPFDDSAAMRLQRMGLLTPDNTPDERIIRPLAYVSAGLYYGQLCNSVPQYCILKSHKAAVFPSLPWPSVSVICEFFKMTEWRKNAVKKKKNFSKSWPKQITSNGVFSKRERESPFPAAKEDDALKLPRNQKERVLHIFDSYCKKILRQENVDM